MRLKKAGWTSACSCGKPGIFLCVCVRQQHNQIWVSEDKLGYPVKDIFQWRDENILKGQISKLLGGEFS